MLASRAARMIHSMCLQQGIQRPNISSRTLPCRSQQQPPARRVSPRAAALHRASAERLPAARLWLPAPEASIAAASCTPGRSQCRLRTSVAVSQWQWSTSVEGSRRRLPRRAQAVALEGDIAYEPRKKGFKTPKKVIPPPTFVKNGCFPLDDEEAWQNNVVLIDKPLEWTSFGICGKLRGALDIKKIGHAGTLDPLATGLLIVCTGKGTKRVDSFVAMEKVYSGTMRLGQATPSFDAETEPSEEVPWAHLTDADLREAAAKLTGDILQLPPMFSAIKIKGKKLYEAARAGEEIERVPRPVVVSEFEVWREGGAQDVHFRVRCSKGTYIRSLAHDLGQSLGSAAHLRSLRREAIGEYSVEDAWSFEELVTLGQERRAQRREAKAAAAAAQTETAVAA